NRPPDVRLPVPLIARSAKTRLGSRGAGLRFFRQDSLSLVEIDNRHGIAALALRRAVDARREVGFMLRSVGDLRDFRLAWEIAGKAIGPVRKFDPFLCEQRARQD